MKSSKGTKIWIVILVIFCFVQMCQLSSLKQQNDEMSQELQRISNSLGDTRRELYTLLEDIENDKTAEELQQEELAMFKWDGYQSFGNKRLTMAGDLIYLLNVDEDIESMELVFGDQTFSMSNDKEGSVFFEGSTDIDVSGAVNDEVRVKVLYIHAVTESGVEYKIYPEFSEWMSYQVKDITNDSMAINQVYEVEKVQ